MSLEEAINTLNKTIEAQNMLLADNSAMIERLSCALLSKASEGISQSELLSHFDDGPAEEAPAEEAPAEEAPAEEAPAEEDKPEVTKDDVQSALIDLCKAKGKDVGKAVLAEFKCAKVSDIDPQDYLRVLEALKKAGV